MTKPNMSLRRIGMCVKWDPITLWYAALVVSIPLSLSGFWGFRKEGIFTNAVLLIAASVVCVRFYRERHPVLAGICVFSRPLCRPDVGCLSWRGASVLEPASLAPRPEPVS